MNIQVLKIAESQNSTLSQMRIDGAFFCFVIEDGHRDVKVSGETRIPAGTYKVQRRTHGGFYGHFESRAHLIAAALEQALADGEKAFWSVRVSVFLCAIPNRIAPWLFR